MPLMPFPPSTPNLKLADRGFGEGCRGGATSYGTLPAGRARSRAKGVLLALSTLAVLADALGQLGVCGSRRLRGEDARAAKGFSSTTDERRGGGERRPDEDDRWRVVGLLEEGGRPGQKLAPGRQLQRSVMREGRWASGNARRLPGFRSPLSRFP